MTLQDLVGRHVLSGADSGILKGAFDGEDANRFFFVLDGKTYMVTENPSDGYRSSMEGIELLCEGEIVANRFESVHVDCELVAGEHDVLEMCIAGTDMVVLEVGTRDADDYYPYFVARFDPKVLTAHLSTVEAMALHGTDIGHKRSPARDARRRAMRIGGGE